MRHSGKSCGALGNTFDAGSGGYPAVRGCDSELLRSTGLWKALTYTFPHHKH
jgi:hypothetical protein